MKRVFVLLLSCLAIVVVMMIVFSNFSHGRKTSEKGHVRQAFFSHVGTVYFASNPNIVKTDDLVRISLILIDEESISEFSDVQNIKKIDLIGENGGNFEAELQSLGSPGEIKFKLAGKKYIEEYGKTLFSRIMVVNVRPVPGLDEYVVTRIRISFADGIVEEFPIGRLRFIRIPDELVLNGNLFRSRFNMVNRRLFYKGVRYESTEMPLGMQSTFLSLRLPSAGINALGKADAREEIVDIDLGLEGIYVDWSQPVYADEMRKRPAIDGAVRKRYAEWLKEDPKLELEDWNYFSIMTDVLDISYFYEEELEGLAPSLFLPEEFYVFKRGRPEGSFPSGINLSAMPRDSDGAPLLEAWYPVYYDPDSDFTNTVLFFHPVVKVNIDGVIKYRLASQPDVIYISRYADFDELLKEQNP